MQQRRSSETEIFLRNVDLNTTGQFRCEISGEAPLFQTAFREAIMAVVGKLPQISAPVPCLKTSFLDLPDEGPVIEGGFPRYHLGDKVSVNCTSFRSKPAAKLKWYINGEQADPALVKHYKVRIAAVPNGLAE